MVDDRKRMERVYSERRSLSARYSLDILGNRFNYEILKNSISAILKTRFPDLSKVSLLDVGAGDLLWVEEFIRMGCDQSRCVGADLLTWRLQEARKKGREAISVVASGDRLPFRSDSFDLVCQFTMMTSILDRSIKDAVASDMRRVLRPGGYILWYDFRYNNPANPNTRAIGRGELERLFSGWPLHIQTTTLIPQLARKINARFRPILKLLYRFPILRSHYLAVIGPKG